MPSEPASPSSVTGAGSDSPAGHTDTATPAIPRQPAALGLPAMSEVERAAALAALGESDKPVPEQRGRPFLRFRSFRTKKSAGPAISSDVVAPSAPASPAAPLSPSSSPSPADPVAKINEPFPSERPPGAPVDPWTAFVSTPERPPGLMLRATRAFFRSFIHEYALAIYAGLLLAVGLTWPTLRYPLHTLPEDLGDPSRQAWQISWVGHILLTHPQQLWQSNAFFPDSNSFAFGDSLLGYAPAGMIGDGPLAATLRYNILFVLAHALLAIGGYALVRQLGSGRTGAAVAAVAIAYAPWRLAQEGHLDIISAGGIPLALAMLARGHGWSLRRGLQPKERNAGWAAFGWLLAAWQVSLGFSLGLPFLGVLGLIVLLLLFGTPLLWLRRRSRRRAHQRRLAAAAAPPAPAVGTAASAPAAEAGTLPAAATETTPQPGPATASEPTAKTAALNSDAKAAVELNADAKAPAPESATPVAPSDTGKPAATEDNAAPAKIGDTVVDGEPVGKAADDKDSKSKADGRSKGQKKAKHKVPKPPRVRVVHDRDYFPVLGWRLLIIDSLGPIILAGIAALIALPYFHLADKSNSTAEIKFFSPPLWSLLIGPAESRIWGSPHAAARASLGWAAEMSLLPGFVLFALALAGLWFSVWKFSRRILLIIVLAAAVVLTMGTSFFHGRWTYLPLFGHLPASLGQRIPGRMVFWVTLLLGILAAGAVAEFVRRAEHWSAQRIPPWPAWWLRLATLVPLILVLAEGWNTTAHPVVPAQPASMRTITSPMLVLPTGAVTDGTVMLWSTSRYQKIANGSGGFAADKQAEMRTKVASFPDATSIQYLRDRHIKTVVLVRAAVAGTPWERAGDTPVDSLGITREDTTDSVVFHLN